MSEGAATSFTAIVVLDQHEQDPEFDSVLKQIKKHLVNNGVFLLVLSNPLYYREILRKVGSAQNISKSVLEGLATREEEMQGNFSSRARKVGFFVDQSFRWADPEGAAFVRQRIAEASDEMAGLWKKLRRQVGAECVIHRLIDFHPQQLRIQAQLLKPVGGVNDVRINEPFGALATYPGVICRASQHEEIVRGWSDRLNKIFILHRPILTLDIGLKLIQRLREEGYLIITEFDDHYSPWPAIEQNKFLNFVGCHAVQTSTIPLAELFMTFNPEVGVFPNQLNRMPARDLRNPSETAEIFFGALNRQKDWAPILPAINKMLRQVEGRYHFNVVFDQKFYDQLETDHKRFIPQCSYEEYLKVLEGADIALLPLEDSLFNRMKSDLKLVEVAGAGAVPIASHVVYKNTVGADTFTEFAVTGDEFAEKLKYLIEDPASRLLKQNAARRYVRRHRLLHLSIQRRYQWLLSLLEKRDDLDQMLEHRLQQL